MFEIGDRVIVLRDLGTSSAGAVGRVTGIEKEGYPRVRLHDNGYSYWLPTYRVMVTRDVGFIIGGDTGIIVDVFWAWDAHICRIKMDRIYFGFTVNEVWVDERDLVLI